MKHSTDAISTTDILTCMSTHYIQATQNDMPLEELKDYIIRGLQSSKNKVKQDVRPYWILLVLIV